MTLCFYLTLASVVSADLDTGSVENGMTLLTLGAYCHSRTIELFRNMPDEYQLWGNKFFAPFKKHRLIIEHPALFDDVYGLPAG